MTGIGPAPPPSASAWPRGEEESERLYDWRWCCCWSWWSWSCCGCNGWFVPPLLPGEEGDGSSEDGVETVYGWAIDVPGVVAATAVNDNGRGEGRAAQMSPPLSAVATTAEPVEEPVRLNWPNALYIRTQMMHNNNRNVKINQIETKVTKKKTHSNKKETGKIHETKDNSVDKETKWNQHAIQTWYVNDDINSTLTFLFFYSEGKKKTKNSYRLQIYRTIGLIMSRAVLFMEIQC